MVSQSAAFVAATFVGGSGGVVAALSGLTPSPRDNEGGGVSAIGSDARRALVECGPEQHTILFTLYTDTHSILDNSWELSHASYGYGYETGNSGTYIDSESVATGNLGYGAVLTHAVCADRSAASETDPAGTLVESCYDLELRDANGDGLTAPHSAQGGLAGGFSVEVDGTVVAEHRGKACLSDNEKEWNDCAVESGFKYCGVRLCILMDGEGKSTLSSLSGSQCTFSQPQCDSDSAIKTSSSSISVTVDTDSFSQELSWEVRSSSKSDSKKMKQAMANDLILAGGMPVRHDDTDDILLGQIGVGVPLADNESFESMACISDDQAQKSCFDFRAYDEYGDGMGCGADGALSVSIQTLGENDAGVPRLERVTLTQRDKDMAKRQSVNGKNRLACMNEKKLSKWSYCAVRVCANGDVIGLEGNQCDFGFGEDLIDPRYIDIDPLLGSQIKPQSGNDLDRFQTSEEEEEEDHAIVIMTEDVQLNIVNGSEEIDNSQSWAEYYEALGPGFRDDMNSFSALSGIVGGKVPDTVSADLVNKPLEMGDVGFNFASMKPINKNDDEGKSKKERSKKKMGVKGPRPNKAKLDNQENLRPRPDMIPGEKNEMQQFNDQVANQRPERVDLKPFSVNLLQVKFPYKIKDSGSNQLSHLAENHLQSYFVDYAKSTDDIPAPTQFRLDCTKSKKSIGPEIRWVVDCAGTAEFQMPSSELLPTKREMSRLIRDAFTGKPMKKFLNTVYNFGSDLKINDKKQTMMEKLQGKKKKNKKQQQLQLHGQLNEGGSDYNSAQQQKKQEKLEKIEAKKQMKLDRIEAKQQNFQAGELNVMGYVSGTQGMNAMSDEDRGYTIINGDIHIHIEEDDQQEKSRGEGRGKGMSRERERRRRKGNRE